jgi:hypothetical protein
MRVMSVVLLHKNKSHFIVKGMMTALLLSVSNVSTDINIYACANSFKTNAFEVNNYIYNKITYTPSTANVSVLCDHRLFGE